MTSIFKAILILILSATSTVGFTQLDMNKFAGKKYNKLYKEIINDSTFTNCSIMNSSTNKVNGIRLFFKNDISYVVSFRKGKLNDTYTCESGPIRAMKIYVIHKYKGTEYQEGYCRCSADEKGQLIKPISKEGVEE